MVYHSICMGSITVSTKIPEKQYRRIEKEVESGQVINISDYVRQAIREKLKRDRGE